MEAKNVLELNNKNIKSLLTFQLYRLYSFILLFEFCSIYAILMQLNKKTVPKH